MDIIFLTWTSVTINFLMWTNADFWSVSLEPVMGWTIRTHTTLATFLLYPVELTNNRSLLSCTCSILTYTTCYTNFSSIPIPIDLACTISLLLCTDIYTFTCTIYTDTFYLMHFKSSLITCTCSTRHTLPVLTKFSSILTDSACTISLMFYTDLHLYLYYLNWYILPNAF